MLKKHEHAFLRTNWAALDALLAARSEVEDPIGFMQFSARKIEIEDELRQLADRPDLDLNFSIVFGGGPVSSARGIDAEFAGKALLHLQALVTSQFLALAASEHATSERATRTPSSSQHRVSMVLTEVARGSAGFVFELAVDGDGDGDANALLHTVIDRIGAMMWQMSIDGAHVGDERSVGAATSYGNEGSVDEASAVDASVGTALRDFIALLDVHKATLRFVGGKHDFVLDQQTVAGARELI